MDQIDQIGLSGYLKDAFCMGKGGILSLVGAGGKTSLMLRLAEELRCLGLRVVTTTTTKVYPPGRESSPLLIVEGDESLLMKGIERKISSAGHITITSGIDPDGKLIGVREEFLSILRKEGVVHWILVEADGAKGYPIKAPAEHEPVIPRDTTMVVPLVGLDGLNKALDHSSVFRPWIFSNLTGLSMGEKVDVESVARLVVNKEGLLKGVPVGVQVIPFLNKADLPGCRRRGRELGQRILELSSGRIRRVVVGQALGTPPVVEILERG